MFYDPMVSKLIVWAPSRTDAIARMKRALYAYKITGIKTTIPFLSRIMDVPDFVNGKYNTHFIEDNQQYLLPANNASQRLKDIAAISAFIDFLKKIESKKASAANESTLNQWKMAGRNKNLSRL
jgi:acetyl-CoA carboxylase biotin carboxylase subunit